MTTPNLLERALTVARRRHLRGTERALRILRGNNVSYPIRVRTVHGVVMYADPSDWGDRAVLERGSYELEVSEAIHASLRPADTFWDIGANSGLHALTVHRLFPGVAMVCFEPSPFAFCRLVRNARLNNALDATLLNVALSDRAGYAPLDVCIAERTGTTTLVADGGATHGGQRFTMSCRIETAERIVAEALAPAPNIVKIDVEGHERAVLRGFGALLDSPRLRTIVFEGEDAAPVLERAGFAIEALPKHHAGDNSAPNMVARRG